MLRRAGSSAQEQRHSRHFHQEQVLCVTPLASIHAFDVLMVQDSPRVDTMMSGLPQWDGGPDSSAASSSSEDKFVHLELMRSSVGKDRLSPISWANRPPQTSLGSPFHVAMPYRGHRPARAGPGLSLVREKYGCNAVGGVLTTRSARLGGASSFGGAGLSCCTRQSADCHVSTGWLAGFRN